MRTELPKSLYLPGDLCRLVFASSIFQGGLEARPWGVFRSGWSKGKGVGGPKRVGAYGSELPGASDSQGSGWIRGWAFPPQSFGCPTILQ